MKELPDCMLRPGTRPEADALRAMAARSKQVWGYDDVYMRDWLSEWVDWLTDFARFDVEQEGSPAGFYALDDLGDGSAELWALFVDPTRLRRGLGRLLMQDAVARAKRRKFDALLIHADPNAVGFYQAWQVMLLDETPCPRVTGQLLPTFRLPLTNGT